MANKIKQSKLFVKKVAKLLEYLEKNWSKKVKFQSIPDSKIDELSNHPTAGRVTAKNKSIRKLKIKKHNRIYYRFLKDEINILTLFETKMNRKRNKYE